ncbi:uncharacterized protein ASPGLDRAFT_40976 [Aspergillus glaucus CBS 516.65]|uniref:Amino acid permease/ SLC12A domain-containing protein n=1 Tax=Aspergillus glaucus CBS 516.65 TaxID=1160497 RepID=A0A1L9VYS3_ASPGL|nr:hypothetical protein ASPGLDRAFT_40976 [Aspergillus glaucus CBS 516.65]OJJ89055.1 hypothetical protein ASPGLDRAFT_40976 [Aspergillus glaucus CBS 516.65]
MVMSLGSFLLMFGSFSFQASVGTIQDYISTHQLSDYSVRDVGWITAVLVFLTLFLGFNPYHCLIVMDRACY